MKKKINEYDIIISSQVTTIKEAMINLIKISNLVDMQKADPEEYSWYLDNIVLPKFMENIDEVKEYFNTITKTEFVHIIGCVCEIVAHHHSLKLANCIKERYFTIFSKEERANNQDDTETIENIEYYV